MCFRQACRFLEYFFSLCHAGPVGRMAECQESRVATGTRSTKFLVHGSEWPLWQCTNKKTPADGGGFITLGLFAQASGVWLLIIVRVPSYG
jgi:hypothetical protein